MHREGPALQTLSFEELDSAESAGFRELYRIYEATFPLADEREPPEAFAAILALNRDRQAQLRYGPYREIVAAIRAGERGPVVGGHVFGIVTSPAHGAFGVPASIQGIYTFLDGEARGLLPIAAVVAYSRSMASRAFDTGARVHAHPPPIVFEVNNPLRMTEREIALDTRHSGIDPSRRYMFWLRSGFTPLAFPYVQPRLREDAQPVRYLDLFCSNDTPQGIPAKVLRSHLYSFVSLSVLKSCDARQDRDFVAMEAWLEGRDEIGFVDRHGSDIREIARRARVARSQEARQEVHGARST